MLKKDNPRAPEIEDRLSAIENDYAHLLGRLRRLEDIEEREYITLAVFVGALFWRIPAQMLSPTGEPTLRFPAPST